MSKDTERLSREEEQALIERCRSGDSDALNDLLDTHQDRVFRTAMTMVQGDQEAATELAQEVLISAFRHLHQFRGESRLSTWLYRMTVNFSKNLKMSQGRQKARFVSIDQINREKEEENQQRWEPRDEALSPSEILQGKDISHHLLKAIDSLADEFKDVLVLRYIEDLSYEEISKELELPAGTVKSRINRGRKYLREALEDSPIKDVLPK